MTEVATPDNTTRLPTPRLRKVYSKIVAAGEGGLSIYELGKIFPGLHSASLQNACRELVKFGKVNVGVTSDKSRMYPNNGNTHVNIYIDKRAGR